ncbi:hypothetical protein AMAG_06143 [Allomyces macrogynus ATCC 38327]|uniref:PhoD-like phosphatase metallophosphatase domain-containing protein n=1 Tax=Allomyces macrogynus (strain ATCC 38327) TaxID=578462 RepID=A0A0L0SEB9_ALLM3|nr:hypothetical protein AMAG_06143 [Allomyces macrogynus ATCC 38327]|eukprot:KNE60787.1 hypothetical protein AMAG_06143 [Allomyces macrogynus ATCC 38327]
MRNQTRRTYNYEYGLPGYKPVGGAMPASRDPVPAKVISNITDLCVMASLQLLHAQEPWIVAWDDHEFADSAWVGGAVDQNDKRDGPWGGQYRVYRSFQIGNLVDLIMLYTRIDGRAEQAKGDRVSRQIMGATQDQWLHSSLKSSRAKWRFLGNQLMFATLPEKLFAWELPIAADAWVGYPGPGQALLDLLAKNKICNTVMITGDFHGSVASDIPADRQGQVQCAVGHDRVCLTVDHVGITRAGLSHLEWARQAGLEARQPVGQVDRLVPPRGHVCGHHAGQGARRVHVCQELQEARWWRDGGRCGA